MVFATLILYDNYAGHLLWGMGGKTSMELTWWGVFGAIGFFLFGVAFLVWGLHLAYEMWFLGWKMRGQNKQPKK